MFNFVITTMVTLDFPVILFQYTHKTEIRYTGVKLLLNNMLVLSKPALEWKRSWVRLPWERTKLFFDNYRVPQSVVDFSIHFTLHRIR